MDSINVTVPAALAEQKSTLAKALAEITSKESELTKQRTAIKTTLDRIDAAIAMLMGQTPIKFAASTTRKPMSEESRKKLSEALKRAAASKKAQKMTTETPAAAT